MIINRPTPLILLALVAACGDGGMGTANDPAPQAAAPVLDLTHLANYANPAWPAHIDYRVMRQDNTPAFNPVTDAGATLGRVLFHDRRLSVNDRISCASCHQGAEGFTDSRKFSVGFDGAAHTSVHAMRLANGRFYGLGRGFWDRRAASLEAQSTAAIQSPVEMGFDSAHGGMDSLLAKMRGLPYYPELFRLAFGATSITEERIQQAIAQYVRSIVSLDSKFDKAFADLYDVKLADRGVTAPFPKFTAQENRGKQLFLLAPPAGGAGCGSCHEVPTFALASSVAGNGLDAGQTAIFKAPSLKNVAITGPYMHDGRFATLEQVIEHYASGVQNGPALDYRLRGIDGQPQRLHLSAADKSALVAFLRTLTDRTLTSDPKFSDPFVP